MTVTVFYGCDKGMIITAHDAWEAKQKAMVILEEKYPHRRIREWDLAVTL